MHLVKVVRPKPDQPDRWLQPYAEHCSFGWDTIIAMYKREVIRAKHHLTRMVPYLKEVHCMRRMDPIKCTYYLLWSHRLIKVEITFYGKSMQVCIKWSVLVDPPRAITAHCIYIVVISEALEYLQTCHQLFEAGFLSYERIMSCNILFCIVLRKDTSIIHLGYPHC